ncbi:hypothetical protein ADUPG1_010544, partial [Aduncisulcus paluster]
MPQMNVNFVKKRIKRKVKKKNKKDSPKPLFQPLESPSREADTSSILPSHIISSNPPSVVIPSITAIVPEETAPTMPILDDIKGVTNPYAQDIIQQILPDVSLDFQESPMVASENPNLSTVESPIEQLSTHPEVSKEMLPPLSSPRSQSGLPSISKTQQFKSQFNVTSTLHSASPSPPPLISHSPRDSSQRVQESSKIDKIPADPTVISNPNSSNEHVPELLSPEMPSAQSSSFLPPTFAFLGDPVSIEEAIVKDNSSTNADVPTLDLPHVLLSHQEEEAVVDEEERSTQLDQLDKPTGHHKRRVKKSVKRAHVLERESSARGALSSRPEEHTPRDLHDESTGNGSEKENGSAGEREEREELSDEDEEGKDAVNIHLCSEGDAVNDNNSIVEAADKDKEERLEEKEEDKEYSMADHSNPEQSDEDINVLADETMLPEVPMFRKSLKADKEIAKSLADLSQSVTTERKKTKKKQKEREEREELSDEDEEGKDAVNIHLCSEGDAVNDNNSIVEAADKDKEERLEEKEEDKEYSMADHSNPEQSDEDINVLADETMLPEVPMFRKSLKADKEIAKSLADLSQSVTTERKKTKKKQKEKEKERKLKEKLMKREKRALEKETRRLRRIQEEQEKAEPQVVINRRISHNFCVISIIIVFIVLLLGAAIGFLSWKVLTWELPSLSSLTLAAITGDDNTLGDGSELHGIFTSLSSALNVSQRTAMSGVSYIAGSVLISVDSLPTLEEAVANKKVYQNVSSDDGTWARLSSKFSTPDNNSTPSGPVKPNSVSINRNTSANNRSKLSNGDPYFFQNYAPFVEDKDSLTYKPDTSSGKQLVIASEAASTVLLAIDSTRLITLSESVIATHVPLATDSIQVTQVQLNASDGSGASSVLSYNSAGLVLDSSLVTSSLSANAVNITNGGSTAALTVSGGMLVSSLPLQTDSVECTDILVGGSTSAVSLSASSATLSVGGGVSIEGAIQGIGELSLRAGVGTGSLVFGSNLFSLSHSLIISGSKLSLADGSSSLTWDSSGSTLTISTDVSLPTLHGGSLYATDDISIGASSSASVLAQSAGNLTISTPVKMPMLSVGESASWTVFDGAESTFRFYDNAVTLSVIDGGVTDGGKKFQFSTELSTAGSSITLSSSNSSKIATMTGTSDGLRISRDVIITGSNLFLDGGQVSFESGTTAGIVKVYNDVYVNDDLYIGSTGALISTEQDGSQNILSLYATHAFSTASLLLQAPAPLETFADAAEITFNGEYITVSDPIKIAPGSQLQLEQISIVSSTDTSHLSVLNFDDALNGLNISSSLHIDEDTLTLSSNSIALSYDSSTDGLSIDTNTLRLGDSVMSYGVTNNKLSVYPVANTNAIVNVDVTGTVMLSHDLVIGNAVTLTEKDASVVGSDGNLKIDAVSSHFTGSIAIGSTGNAVLSSDTGYSISSTVPFRIPTSVAIAASSSSSADSVALVYSANSLKIEGASNVNIDASSLNIAGTISIGDGATEIEGISGQMIVSTAVSIKEELEIRSLLSDDSYSTLSFAGSSTSLSSALQVGGSVTSSGNVVINGIPLEAVPSTNTLDIGSKIHLLHELMIVDSANSLSEASIANDSSVLSFTSPASSFSGSLAVATSLSLSDATFTYSSSTSTDLGETSVVAINKSLEIVNSIRMKSIDGSSGYGYIGLEGIGGDELFNVSNSMKIDGSLTIVDAVAKLGAATLTSQPASTSDAYLYINTPIHVTDSIEIATESDYSVRSVLQFDGSYVSLSDSLNIDGRLSSIGIDLNGVVINGTTSSPAGIGRVSIDSSLKVVDSLTIVDSIDSTASTILSFDGSSSVTSLDSDLTISGSHEFTVETTTTTSLNATTVDIFTSDNSKSASISFYDPNSSSSGDELLKIDAPILDLSGTKIIIGSENSGTVGTISYSPSTEFVSISPALAIGGSSLLKEDSTTTPPTLRMTHSDGNLSLSVSGDATIKSGNLYLGSSDYTTSIISTSLGLSIDTPVLLSSSDGIEAQQFTVGDSSVSESGTFAYEDGIGVVLNETLRVNKKLFLDSDVYLEYDSVNDVVDLSHDLVVPLSVEIGDSLFTHTSSHLYLSNDMRSSGDMSALTFTILGTGVTGATVVDRNSSNILTISDPVKIDTTLHLTDTHNIVGGSGDVDLFHFSHGIELGTSILEFGSDSTISYDESTDLLNVSTGFSVGDEMRIGYSVLTSDTDYLSLESNRDLSVDSGSLRVGNETDGYVIVSYDGSESLTNISRNTDISGSLAATSLIMKNGGGSSNFSYDGTDTVLSSSLVLEGDCITTSGGVAICADTSDQLDIFTDTVNISGEYITFQNDARIQYDSTSSSIISYKDLQASVSTLISSPTFEIFDATRSVRTHLTYDGVTETINTTEGTNMRLNTMVIDTVTISDVSGELRSSGPMRVNSKLTLDTSTYLTAKTNDGAYLYSSSPVKIEGSYLVLSGNKTTLSWDDTNTRLNVDTDFHGGSNISTDGTVRIDGTIMSHDSGELHIDTPTTVFGEFMVGPSVLHLTTITTTTDDLLSTSNPVWAPIVNFGTSAEGALTYESGRVCVNKDFYVKTQLITLDPTNSVNISASTSPVGRLLSESPVQSDDYYVGDTYKFSVGSDGVDLNTNLSLTGIVYVPETMTFGTSSLTFNGDLSSIETDSDFGIPSHTLYANEVDIGVEGYRTTLKSHQSSNALEVDGKLRIAQTLDIVGDTLYFGSEASSLSWDSSNTRAVISTDYLVEGDLYINEALITGSASDLIISTSATVNQSLVLKHPSLGSGTLSFDGSQVSIDQEVYTPIITTPLANIEVVSIGDANTVELSYNSSPAGLGISSNLAVSGGEMLLGVTSSGAILKYSSSLDGLISEKHFKTEQTFVISNVELDGSDGVLNVDSQIKAIESLTLIDSVDSSITGKLSIDVLLMDLSLVLKHPSLGSGTLSFDGSQVSIDQEVYTPIITTPLANIEVVSIGDANTVELSYNSSPAGLGISSNLAVSGGEMLLGVTSSGAILKYSSSLDGLISEKHFKTEQTFVISNVELDGSDGVLNVDSQIKAIESLTLIDSVDSSITGKLSIDGDNSLFVSSLSLSLPSLFSSDSISCDNTISSQGGIILTGTSTSEKTITFDETSNVYIQYNIATSVLAASHKFTTPHLSSNQVTATQITIGTSNVTFDDVTSALEISTDLHVDGDTILVGDTVSLSYSSTQSALISSHPIGINGSVFKYDSGTMYLYNIDSTEGNLSTDHLIATDSLTIGSSLLSYSSDNSRLDLDTTFNIDSIVIEGSSKTIQFDSTSSSSMKYDSDRFHFSHDIVTASNRLSINVDSASDIVSLNASSNNLTIEGNELVLEGDVFTMGSSLISLTDSSGTLTVSSPVSTNGSVTIDTIELSRSASYGLSIDESLIITGSYLIIGGEDGSYISDSSGVLNIGNSASFDEDVTVDGTLYVGTVSLSENSSALSISGAIESDGSYISLSSGDVTMSYSGSILGISTPVTVSGALTADSVSIGSAAISYSAANTSLSISTPVIVNKIVHFDTAQSASLTYDSTNEQYVLSHELVLQNDAVSTDAVTISTVSSSTLSISSALSLTGSSISLGSGATSITYSSGSLAFDAPIEISATSLELNTLALTNTTGTLLNVGGDLSVSGYVSAVDYLQLNDTANSTS